MKSIRLIIAVVICVAVIYSCKTSSVKPTSQNTTSTDAVAAQIALSLSKSFTGQYGGTNINQGIKSPYSIAHRGLAINGIYDLCGTGIDTTFNTTKVSHDTTIVSGGHFKFIYSCGSAGVDGYTVADSINNAYGGAAFYNTNAVAQNYLVKALDNTYKIVSVDGSIGTKSHVFTVNASHVTTEYHDLVSQYVFNNVHADLSGAVGDFTQGTASYNTDQTDYAVAYGTTANVTHYHGLITYLGNNMATMTIQVNNIGDVITYSVNMITGATTKI